MIGVGILWLTTLVILVLEIFGAIVLGPQITPLHNMWGAMIVTLGVINAIIAGIVVPLAAKD